MKIIDFVKKGNVVRFYLGKHDCNDYWGDDWSDTPYEENAGEVYEKYVTAIMDVAFPLDYSVLEPCDNWQSKSTYSKEDMKKGVVPCIIIAKREGYDYNDSFDRALKNKNSIEFYFELMFNKVVAATKRLNGKVLKFVKVKYNEDEYRLEETINLLEDLLNER